MGAQPLRWHRHPTRLSQWLVRWALAYHGLYSFKVGGFETPLAYAMLALATALEPSTLTLKRRPRDPLTAPRP